MADDVVPDGTFGDYSASNSTATAEPSNYEICMRSGFKVKAGTLIKEWTGLWVRPQDWEARHPQEFVRGKPEQAHPSVSPEQTDTFSTTYGLPLATEIGEFISLEDSTGYVTTEFTAVSYA